MYSTNADTILEQIKAKVNEILPLVKELVIEDRQLVKKFLTERVHEIFLVLDEKQHRLSALEFDQNASNSQMYNQSRTSDQMLNPRIVESNVTKLLSNNNSIESREILATEISAIPVFSDYKPGATSESESVKISDLSLRPSGNFDTTNFSSNQYLSVGIGNLNEAEGEQHTDSEINDFKLDDKEDPIIDAAVSTESTYIVTDDLDNDEATQQLMDEIDDIKPKSNLPFVKDGTPDTTYTTASEDVSSLLSFLPQLSPYIKFDLRDSNIGEKEGYIHLTVERADGSVQNLKLAATAASPEECAQYDNQRTLKSNCGDKQLSLIQKDLMDKENDLFKGKNSPKESPQLETLEEKEVASNQRSRGRPRKQDIYHSKMLESGQKVFVCNICKSSAQTQHAMTVHMRKHSGEKPYTCVICAKSFTTKGNLKNHAITHRDEKPWSCPYCDKTFKEKRVLLTHQRIHTGEKPFKCSLCEKSFTQSGVLKEHLLVHSGQKPHLCDLCGQEFRGLSSLRAHKLRHLQRKDFKCDKCEKDFICKADLTRHYMTHTGSRPFMCSLCPKSFTRLNYLKEHLNGHYGNKPYTCSECSAAFPDSISLHRHKRKHKIDKDDVNKPTIQNQSELQKQLIMDSQSTKVVPNIPSFEIMQQTQLGDQSFQFVLDENTTMEDIQKLQSLLSSTNNSDMSTGPDPAQQPVQPMYQVMCMNPDTQEIVEPNRNDQVVVEGSSAYMSAINMLANATTSQQYSFSIQ